MHHQHTLTAVAVLVLVTSLLFSNESSASKSLPFRSNDEHDRFGDGQEFEPRLPVAAVDDFDLHGVHSLKGQFEVLAEDGQHYPKERDVMCGYEGDVSARGYLAKVPTNASSYAGHSTESGLLLPHQFTFRNMMQFTTRVPHFAIPSIAIFEDNRIFGVMHTTAQQTVDPADEDLCVHVDGIYHVCSPTASTIIGVEFPMEKTSKVDQTFISFGGNHKVSIQHMVKNPTPRIGALFYGVQHDDKRHHDEIRLVRVKKRDYLTADYIRHVINIHPQGAHVTFSKSTNEAIMVVMRDNTFPDLALVDSMGMNTPLKCSLSGNFVQHVIVFDYESGNVKRHRCIMSHPYTFSQVTAVTTNSEGSIFLMGMASDTTFYDVKGENITSQIDQFILSLSGFDMQVDWITWINGNAALRPMGDIFLNNDETRLLFLFDAYEDMKKWVIQPHFLPDDKWETESYDTFHVVALDPKNGVPLNVSLLGPANLKQGPYTSNSLSFLRSSAHRDVFYLCSLDRKKSRLFIRKYSHNGVLLAERFLGKPGTDSGYLVSVNDFDISEDSDNVTHIIISGSWTRGVYFGEPSLVESEMRRDVFLAHYTEGCSCDKPNCLIPTCRGSQKYEPLTCASRGVCIDVDNCKCELGYSGNDCEFIECHGKLSNESDVCSGFGRCIAPNSCQCESGHVGDNCELYSCFHHASTDQEVCSSGRGACVESDKCRCSDISWTGAQCETVMAFDAYSSCDSGLYRIIPAEEDIVAARRIRSDIWVHHRRNHDKLILAHSSRIYVDNVSPKQSPQHGAVYVVGQYTRHNGANATEEICMIGRMRNDSLFGQNANAENGYDLEFAWYKEIARIATRENRSACPEVITIDPLNDYIFISGYLGFYSVDTEVIGFFIEAVDAATGNVIDSKSMTRNDLSSIKRSFSVDIRMDRTSNQVVLAGSVAGPMLFSSRAQLVADPISSPYMTFALKFNLQRGSYLKVEDMLFQIGMDIAHGTKPETFATSLEVASNGDVVLVGYWRHETMIDNDTYDTKDVARGIIIRYSQETHDIVWKLLTDSFDVKSRLTFLDSQLDQFDNLYITGLALGKVVIDTLNPVNTSINSTSTGRWTDGDPFVMRVDTNGNVIWVHQFERHFSSTRDEAQHDLNARTVKLTLSRKGALFVAFGVRGSVRLANHTMLEEAEDRLVHMHIAKFDMLTGRVIWTKSFMHEELQQSSVFDMSYREDDDMIFVMAAYNSEQRKPVKFPSGVILPGSTGEAREITSTPVQSPMDPFILIIRDSHCLPCAVGSYGVNGDCKPCGPNEYSNRTGLMVCEQCPAGTYCNGTGSMTIENCVPCVPGTARNESSSACMACPPTTYATEHGMSECERCPMAFQHWILESMGSVGADNFFYCLFFPITISIICAVLVGLLMIVVAFLGGFAYTMRKYRRVRLNQKSELEMALLGDSAHSTGTNSGPRFEIDKTMFETSFSEFSDLQEIATGGSGAVLFTAKWQNQTVVLKIWRLSPFDEGAEFDTFEDEIHLLSSIRSANVVNFLGAILEHPRIAIVLEYCSKGSLLRLLSEESLPWHRRLGILRDVVIGMVFLHSRSIIHRDLKSDNILVDRNYQAKVSDFGCSKRQDLAIVQQHTKYVGTSLYMAPEVTLGEVYDERCDVYSFGIIMYEVLTMRQPFEGVPKYNIEMQVAKRPDLRPQMPDDEMFIQGEESSDAAGDQAKYVELMRRCWQHDQTVRPSFDDILPILDGFQENLLL